MITRVEVVYVNMGMFVSWCRAALWPNFTLISLFLLMDVELC